MLFSPAHYDHMGHSELLVERVTKEDSGSYTCVAENTAGTVQSVAFVYVKGAPPHPPRSGPALCGANE